jgi:hypothetical protein
VICIGRLTRQTKRVMLLCLGSDVATKLYPHQKKALTFLLEREREKPGSDGKFSSLWQLRTNNMSHRPYWFHTITTKEVFQEPKETKGSILADDVRVVAHLDPHF